MPRAYRAICKSCGKEAEYADCSGDCPPMDDAPCSRLKGWLTVSQWKGTGSVDELDFCSFTCLGRWVEAQTPQVPRAFLSAFQDE